LNEALLHAATAEIRLSAIRGDILAAICRQQVDRLGVANRLGLRLAGAGNEAEQDQAKTATHHRDTSISGGKDPGGQHRERARAPQ